MNYASEVVKELAKGSDACHVVLAAGRPPLIRQPDGMVSLWDAPLTPQDVTDTLAGLRTHAEPTTAIGRQGRFSFGLRELGRFRVSYLTQRGSLTAQIARIPLAIPPVEEVLADADAAREAERLFRRAPHGLLVISGPSTHANNRLVYALIQRINETEDKLVQIVEDGLTFLVRHGRSAVLQTELGVDSDDLAACLQGLRQMSSDVLYVRDVLTAEDLLRVAQAASSLFAVVTTSALDAERILKEGSGMDFRLLLGVWRTEPREDRRLILSQETPRY